MSKITFDKSAMARGILILDENLKFLASELQNCNFRVYVVPDEMRDEDIVRLGVLPHKPFVTTNTRDFIADMEAYEFSIIDCSHVGDLDAKTLGTMISKAWSEFQLGSKRQYLLTLQRDGKHQILE